MTRRSGVTLIEVLIVIAIIGILLQLLLPAVQGARESARRTTCQAKLQQIGIAFQNYDAANGQLPVGGQGVNVGTWMVPILAMVEENEASQSYVWDAALEAEKGYEALVNLPVTGIHYQAFLCPSDTPLFDVRTRHQRVSKHNYVVNFGNTGVLSPGINRDGSRTGALVPEYEGVEFGGAPFSLANDDGTLYKPVKLASIKDGISKTIFASETIQTNGNDSRAITWASLTAGFTTYRSPNSEEMDILTRGPNKCDPTEPNPPCRRRTGESEPITIAARSLHTGGVNVVMGDASSRFIDDNIDLTVWREMSTIQGKETVAP